MADKTPADFPVGSTVRIISSMWPNKVGQTRVVSHYSFDYMPVYVYVREPSNSVSGQFPYLPNEIELVATTETHHVDCDRYQSAMARETEAIFGVSEGEQPTDLFDCNLNCAADLAEYQRVEIKVVD